MEEQHSWIRRTKYSHSVYQRSGSARPDPGSFHHSSQFLGVRSRVVPGSHLQPIESSVSEVQKSLEMNKHSSQFSGVRSRVVPGSLPQPIESSVSEVQKSLEMNKIKAVSPAPHVSPPQTAFEDKFDQNKLSTETFGTDSPSQQSGSGAPQLRRSSGRSKFRAVSPITQTKIPRTFKEARSNSKRFSTPQPVRRATEKGVLAKFLHKDSCEKRAPIYMSSTNIGELGHFAAMNINDKKKGRKESTWTKYFDHAGGRVTAIESADEWMVDLSKLFLGLKFDHGAYSQLHHGIYKDEPVAVKIIKVPDGDENGDLGAKLEKQYTREATLLTRLHHQNVIKFVAACKKPPVFCIITEYLSDGSLRAYLRKREQKPLSLGKLNSMALDIARGMEFIHSQGIIHRDLKPENILINQDFQLKIADFGIACDEANCDSLTDDPGTYRWMAPEMLKCKYYDKKVDTYSFGLILWEMVTGSLPYKDMTPSQAAFAVLNKNLRPTIPEDCPPNMGALMEQCWSLRPDKRPEFWQVVKVLEQFESSLACDGTLNMVPNAICQDLKKGLLYRMQKLAPVRPNSLPMPKPRFA